MKIEKLITLLNEYGCLADHKIASYNDYVLLTWTDERLDFYYWYLQDDSLHQSTSVRYFDENREIDITEEQVHKWLNHDIMLLKFKLSLKMLHDIKKDFE